MSSEQTVFLAVCGMIAGLAMVFGIGYIVLAALKHRAPSGGAAADAKSLQQQLAQLQTSVDTMALEVERISEGQRFTTKLLAKRGDAARIPAGGGGAR